MTLTVEKVEDEQRQLNLTITVEEGRVQKAMRQYAKKLARDINVQGFRRGKAPFNVIAKRVGKEYLRYQVVEEMLNDVLFEALEQEEINPYARPVLENLDLEPTVLKVTVPLEPVVTLGEYREIRKEIEEVEITEEAVDEAMERVRERHAVTEDLERPSELGDLVTVTGVGALVPEDADEEWELDHSVEDQVFHDHDGTEFVLEEGRYYEGTDFVQKLVGVSTDDEVEFEIVFPDEYEEEELRGRTAKFALEVSAVQSRDVPEMTDELAQEEGEHETVAELREAQREQLVQAAEARIKNEFLDGMVEELHEGAELVYPPGAIEQELDGRVENLQNQIKQYGWEWEDYLQMQGETEESIRDQWREQAATEVERSLVLQQFIRDERLQVKEKEMAAAVEERMERFGDMEDEMKQMMRQFMMGQEGMQTMANDLMMDKIYDRMTLIAEGNAPDLDELEAAEAAAEEEAARLAAEEAMSDVAVIDESLTAVDEEAPADEDETAELEAPEVDEEAAEDTEEEAEEAAEENEPKEE